MDKVFLVIIGLLAGGGLALLVFIFYRRRPVGGESGLLVLQGQINELVRTIDERMNESSRFVQSSVQHQFTESQKSIDRFIKELGQITDKVARVEEAGKQMVGFAGELSELQDILKNPKQRGVLGEYYLETLLKNVLPPGSYEMQYKLGPDEATGKELIPDAVVFVKDKIIPIDSKFSLENYNRLVSEKNETERGRLEKVFVGDLKMRITETAKYIQPEKGTMDFAFMFIPHEAIYYDLLINKIGAMQTEDTENLIQRAAGKYHVLIVSPTSFLAYLQTVLQGLNALRIEESAKEIRSQVANLGKHILAYDGYFRKLGSSLGTTVNQYNSAYKELKKIDKDVVKISASGGEIEPLVLDKPSVEDY